MMVADGDIDLKRLHRKLRDLRREKHRGKSVRKFALEDAHISPDHVAVMEGHKKKKLKTQGALSAPTVFMLHRYLRACGTSLAQFFAEFESVRPKGLTDRQAEILDDVRALVQSGAEAERRVAERIDDVKTWLTTQPSNAEMAITTTQKKKT